MALGVEGVGSNTTRASSFTQALTTAGVDRIGLLIFEQENASNPPVTVSSISDGTNTWVKLDTQLWGLNNGSTEVWWAHIAAAGTYNLAVTLSGGADDCCYCAAAVSGLTDFTDPFDGGFSVQPRGSLVCNSNASEPVTATFNTTDVNSVAFCIMGSNTSSAQGSAPAGWTTDTDQANFSGGLSNGLYVGHIIYSSAQVGTTVTLPVNKANFGFEIIVLSDASFVPAPIHGDAIMAGY